MGPPDLRLPEMEIGLGIISHDTQRFYPKNDIAGVIQDNWLGQRLQVQISSGDDVPYAEFTDGRRPLQLFTRWYGFSYTFPDCEIFLPHDH